MAQYHVGCGLAAIYAGTMSKHGVWKDKSPVTDEAVLAVANFLLDNKEMVTFSAYGKDYCMKITECVKTRSRTK